MKAHIPVVSKVAAALAILLSIGPLVTGLGLVFDFLPTEFPAIQGFYAATPLGHVLWIGSGCIGALSAFLLLRRPALAAISCAIFSAAYVPGATMVWHQFTPGCWLAILAAVLSAVGAVIALRASNSITSKPSETGQSAFRERAASSGETEAEYLSRSSPWKPL